MNFKVRTRMCTWLFVIVAVGTAASFVLIGVVQTRIERSAGDTLEQLVQVERNRLVAELDEIKVDVDVLASSIATIEGLGDGTTEDETLNADLERLLHEAQVSGQEFTSLRVVNRDGEELATTQTANWQPGPLATQAMERRTTLIGTAYADDELGLVAPVVSDFGEVLGAVALGTRLTSIVWLSGSYESLGVTSEALVFQRLEDGSCQLLTDLRFERSAAFSTLDGDFGRECVRDSGDRLYSGRDYRGVETLSAWVDIPETNWGLVMKLDHDEAFAVVNQMRRTMIIGITVIVAITLLMGWFALVRPIGVRLSRAAAAAESLANGNFDALVADPSSDEIGRMSGSMDRLAQDLAEDIERRKEAEAELRWRANTDELTGKMNRGRMSARISELCAGNEDYSLAFMDLDGFKEINDTYGHTTGDVVLQQSADRISRAVTAAGLDGEIARWGGDEFVALFPGIRLDSIGDLTSIIDSQFDEAVATHSGQHRVGISIGVADTSNGRDRDAVLSAADAAMYVMKRRGQGQQRATPKIIRFVEEALESDRVQAYLQPFVSVDESGDVHLIGAEALVRIQNVDGSIESPATFLSGLGSSEQALALDLRVFDRAAAAVGSWTDQSIIPPDFYISSNFGAAAMADPRLLEKVMSTIDRHGLKPSQFQLEIPETAQVVDLQLINALRDIGIRIAIDDVGCQFSNLERLVDIPAHIAKIDRRWIPTKETEGPSMFELIEGLVQQCRMLGLEVIVEGIETDAQLALVRSIGVNRIQGFLFGKPVPIDKFEQLWARPHGQSLRVAAPIAG